MIFSYIYGFMKDKYKDVAELFKKRTGAVSFLVTKLGVKIPVYFGPREHMKLKCGRVEVERRNTCLKFGSR